MHIEKSEYAFGTITAPTAPAERADIPQAAREAARRADWIPLSRLKAQLNCESEDIEDLIARWGFPKTLGRQTGDMRGLGEPMFSISAWNARIAEIRARAKSWPATIR